MLTTQTRRPMLRQPTKTFNRGRPPQARRLSAGFKTFAVFLWMTTVTVIGYGVWHWQEEIREVFEDTATLQPLPIQTLRCIDEYYDVLLAGSGDPILVLSRAALHRAGLVAAETSTQTTVYDLSDLLKGYRSDLDQLTRGLDYLTERGDTHRETIELRDMVLRKRMEIFAIEQVRIERHGQRGPEFLKACQDRVHAVRPAQQEVEARRLAAERPPHHPGSRLRPSRASLDDVSEQASSVP